MLETKKEGLYKIIRYIFAGGIGAVTNIGTFSILFHIIRVWYITSSILAFIIAIFVSFVMQKYWAFRDTDHSQIKTQATKFFIMGGINLLINTLLVFIFVSLAHLNPLVAQILSAGLIAVATYFLYQKFIFTNKTEII